VLANGLVVVQWTQAQCSVSIVPSKEEQMDTAINMQGNVQVADDYTWSYTWQWFYTGGDSAGEVHEELLISDTSGSIIDNKVEASHSAEPAQTYIGGGWGNRALPGGTLNWSFRVIGGDGYLGTTGGSFTVLKPLDS
jgi:hypothetical protein